MHYNIEKSMDDGLGILNNSIQYMKNRTEKCIILVVILCIGYIVLNNRVERATFQNCVLIEGKTIPAKTIDPYYQCWGKSEKLPSNLAELAPEGEKEDTEIKSKEEWERIQDKRKKVKIQNKPSPIQKIIPLSEKQMDDLQLTEKQKEGVKEIEEVNQISSEQELTDEQIAQMTGGQYTR